MIVIIYFMRNRSSFCEWCQLKVGTVHQNTRAISCSKCTITPASGARIRFMIVSCKLHTDARLRQIHRIFHHSSNPEIPQLRDTCTCEKNILRFDVPVENSLWVNVLHSHSGLNKPTKYEGFIKSTSTTLHVADLVEDGPVVAVILKMNKTSFKSCKVAE